MIPVFQTKFYPEGNCLDACIASILEIPLEDCPNYHGDRWTRVYSEFLYNKGFRYVIDRKPNNEDEEPPQGYQIAVIQSPRGDWLHAVVALDGVIIHDPYPGADSSDAEILAWDLLVPINAS